MMLFFVMLFISVGFGQENDQTFQNGNTAYNAGQFEKALLLYKKILESGNTVQLFISILAIVITV